jgi:hypothetical protein
VKITVYSRGSGRFQADESAETAIREALGEGGTVGAAIIDHADTERSGITLDDYAVVTEDGPGSSGAWAGWLTGDRSAEPPADALWPDEIRETPVRWITGQGVHTALWRPDPRAEHREYRTITVRGDGYNGYGRLILTEDAADELIRQLQYQRGYRPAGSTS